MLRLSLAAAWRVWQQAAAQHSERSREHQREREQAASRVVRAAWRGWVRHVEQVRVAAQLRRQQERTANLTVSGAYPYSSAQCVRGMKSVLLLVSQLPYK